MQSSHSLNGEGASVQSRGGRTSNVSTEQAISSMSRQSHTGYSSSSHASRSTIAQPMTCSGSSPSPGRCATCASPCIGYPHPFSLSPSPILSHHSVLRPAVLLPALLFNVLHRHDDCTYPPAHALAVPDPYSRPVPITTSAPSFYSSRRTSPRRGSTSRTLFIRLYPPSFSKLPPTRLQRQRPPPPQPCNSNNSSNSFNSASSSNSNSSKRSEEGPGPLPPPQWSAPPLAR